MRVAVVADLLRANGAGVMARGQAQSLASMGHEVQLLAGAVEDAVRDDMTREGLAVRAFLAHESVFERRSDTWTEQAFRAAARRWLEAELAAVRPDVVLVHNCGRMLDQHRLAALSRVWPVGHVMHDEWFLADHHYWYETAGVVRRTYEFHRPQEVTRHAFSHLWEVAAKAGRLAGVSPSLWLQKRWYDVLPDLPCVHLPNAVDESLFTLGDPAAARESVGLTSSRPVVGFVGSPAMPRKNLGRLVGALDLLRKQHKVRPLLLVVGGEESFVGREANAVVPGGLLERVTDARLAKGAPAVLRWSKQRHHTVVVAHPPRSVIPSLYAAVDVLVHPSLVDNLPTVPVEAGLVGTRCLATDVGGTIETLAEEDGLLPADVTEAALADRLHAELASVAGERADARLKRRSRQLARFSRAVHEPRLAAVVDWLAGGGPR